MKSFTFLRSVRLLPLLIASSFLSLPAFAQLDTNANGLSDVFERQFNDGDLFDPTNPDHAPEADADGDGWTTTEEAIAGTNPFDGKPPAGIVSALISHLSDQPEPPSPEFPDGRTVDVAILSWDTLPGKQYILTASPDLSAGSWLPVGDPIQGDGNPAANAITLTDATGESPERLFWRVQVEDLDSDGDTLTNHEEIMLGTNPFLVDTSSDGIPDGWAAVHGLDPSIDNATGIFQDGPLTNLEAYQAGVQANANSTLADFDGDGVDNELDAMPEDPLIRWAPTTTTRYLLLDLGPDVAGWSPQGLSENGAVVFQEGIWADGEATPHNFPLTTGSLTTEDPEYNMLYEAQSTSGASISPDGNAILAKALAGATEGQAADEEFQWFTISGFGTGIETPWDASNNFGFESGNSARFDPVGISNEHVFSIRRGLFSGIFEPRIEMFTYDGNYIASLPSPDNYEPVSTLNQKHRDVTPSGWVATNLKRNEGSTAWRMGLWSPSHELVSLPAASEGWKNQIFLSEMTDETLAVIGVNQSGYSDVFLQNQGGQFETSAHFAGTAIRAFGGNGTALDYDMKLWANGEWLETADWCPELADLLDAGWYFFIIDSASNGSYLLHQFDYSQQQETTKVLLPVDVKQRIPVIDNNGGDTSYEYETVSAVPWDQPTPEVEIIEKAITGNQLTLTAAIYDVLTDVTEGEIGLTPKIWVNSREAQLVAGDANGIYRLEGYQYQLFPGRNEVTVIVENALGVAAYHMVVVEGDNQQGYEIVEEPAKFPKHPTYPVVYEINGGSFIQENEKISLELGGKLVEVGREEINGITDESTFRSKPFLSVNKPETAKLEGVNAIPADKPVFFANLDEDLEVKLDHLNNGNPIMWKTPQSGLELVSPKAVEILETGLRNLTLEVRARALGDSPEINANLETYREGTTNQDISAVFQNTYQTNYNNLADDAKNDPVSFTVNGITLKDGFNYLSFEFEGAQSPVFEENYHSFRYDSPSDRGVRVYSADQREEVVRDGVVGRPQDSYYSVDPMVDLTEFSTALAKSNCKVVGMMDVKEMFDDEPLKRAFLVRGSPGHVFPAFDRLYEEQGREMRKQTFTPSGDHGAALAGEIGRIRGDAALTESAKDSLNLQIAQSFQILNGFENYVPKTSDAYIDPGDGSSQPNSWVLRGNSLPDDPDTNPTAWNVTNSLSDSSRATSLSGIIHLDSTGENTTYYAETAPSAPWDLNGTRVVSLHFKIEQHDSSNGSQGALQFAFGDGSKSWTCQIKPNQLNIEGNVYNLPTTDFPNGLEADQFYTLKALVADGGNQASFSIEGTDIATVEAQSGGLNGIAFGDPGDNISGKVQLDWLTFDNVELTYTYGIFSGDDHADSEEIDQIGNILLYLRSKGQPFRTALVARWIKLLDPMVYRWLLEKYTGRSDDGAIKELHILTGSDIWFGDTVDLDTDKEYEGFWVPKVTKVTTTINIDKEETKFWSIDKERNDIQLAGILMAWAYEQNEYKTWLAVEEDPLWGEVNAFVMKRKHLVENINKWAKRTDDIMSVGGEIAISVANEGADWALTIKDLSQGEYMAAVGFIPFVPGSAGKAFKVFRKSDGAVIETVHQLSDKIDDFPSGKLKHTDNNDKERLLDFDNLLGDSNDPEIVERLRNLTKNNPIPNSSWDNGRDLLSTFSNSHVVAFKTKEPTKAYRVFSSNDQFAGGNFLTFDQPIHRSQVEMDFALGTESGGAFKNYDRYEEIEIPSGTHVYMGYAAEQGGRFKGGGMQLWIDNIARDNKINWDDAIIHELAQY